MDHGFFSKHIVACEWQFSLNVKIAGVKTTIGGNAFAIHIVHGMGLKTLTIRISQLGMKSPYTGVIMLPTQTMLYEGETLQNYQTFASTLILLKVIAKAPDQFWWHF